MSKVRANSLIKAPKAAPPLVEAESNLDESTRSKLPAGGDLHDVYHRVRQDILRGDLAPGDILNQVHIAKRYGVSRTPVREALRMLQAENLVDAQFQHRTRVTKVTSQEVDAVYATWILMQSLGIALTVPLVSEGELATLRDALDQMNDHSPLHDGTQDEWEHLHIDFHRMLVMHAGPIIKDSIENCWSRSERARRLHMRSAPQSWLASEEEHRDVVVAFEDGSAEEAVHAASRQLARNALAVIASIDPSYEPRAIRQALKLTLQAGSPAADSRSASFVAGAGLPTRTTAKKRARG
ncbi:GntR family transcriptional regulator [Paraburkholderia caribensis]|uniref:GntR family transcriptional regulator n=1 Tax=Paraburkholderia caribensis TaxID=75105 RepID=UPI001314DAF2|nr:GntR family transcriptional regulator [Paraburkholderia caribensis]